jgi:TRAP-type C4-dicarboxylate transport system substrate-binding protein
MTHISRRTAVGGLAAAALVGRISTARAQTLRLTVSAGHPPVFLWVQELQKFFIPEVTKRLAAVSKLTIQWNEGYGGTIAKIGGELDALRDGLADLGVVGTIFHAAEMPLQNVSYFAPFGTSDIKSVARIIAALQEKIPAMGNAWSSNEQVYLGGMGLDTYHLFSSFPVRGIDDLKGRKIMAPGPSANWINGTGAVAVNSSLPEYYNNIKTGVADGVLTFVTGAWPIRLWEVAPHVTKVNFGAMYAVALAANQASFAKLPKAAQEIFRQVGAEYADRVGDEQANRALTYLERMQENGAQVAELAPDERTRWARSIVNPAAAWVKTVEGKGLPARQVLKEYMRAQQDMGHQWPRDYAAELT